MATVTAESLYATAKGYTQGAFIIMASDHRLRLPDDTSIFLAVQNLVGFAVELYLKAWLTADGESPWGHDLENLLDKAKAKGFPANIDGVVATLRSHNSFEYRYMGRDSGYTVRQARLLFEELAELDFVVDTKSGASAGLGLSPLPPNDAAWKLPDDRATWRF